MDRADPYSLARTGQGNVNIHAVSEYAFRMSCQNNHLTVAQWLYSLGEGMDRIDPSSPARKGQGNIKIRPSCQDAFKMCCQCGRLTVAQWLYSLGDIDIHDQGDYAFQWACQNGHLVVAQWLYSLGNVNLNMAPTVSPQEILNWVNQIKK